MFKMSRKAFLMLFMGLSLFSCESRYDYPLVLMGEVTDIDETGAEFHAFIKDISKEGITEYGFVWDYLNNLPDINSSRMNLATPAINGTLNTKITGDLTEDKLYYVRAFASNSEYITYSNVVSFVSKGSLPPYIDSFSPDFGSGGTVVTIAGGNFSSIITRDHVIFGNSHATTNSADMNSLTVTIDPNVTTSGFVDVRVGVDNNSSLSEKQFRLAGVAIIDFMPITVHRGDTLYIKAEDLNDDMNSNIVRISGIIATVCGKSGDTCILWDK